MSRFEEIYPLFQEYDMFAQAIEMIKAPHVYKAMTPYGSYVCKRTKASNNRLQYLGGVLRHLQQRGWEGCIPFTYTKYDEPFVVRGDATYYLTPWANRPADVLAPAEWSPPMIERLAELHHFTQNYRFDDPRQVEPLVNSLLKRWESWLEDTRRYAAEAASRNYPSPFDVVFLANQEFIVDMASTAIKQLAQWREAHRTHAHFRLSIIHGFPHPAHFIVDQNGKGRLINFDRAGFDTPTRDLTLFYRSYFHLGGEDAFASELYRRYTAVFPLRPEEVELLAAFLLYPERVMRDLEIYYCRKQDWNELYAVKRLEKDIDRLIRLCRWVHQAF
ncbi:phosphotransferase [Brevibacillus migulae]|uniref:phosphotransferase n=1 Tax=Brevibacillus migulae TaxID=1644114 RepID=UPI00106E2198|nr:phosphotransferase [Brevibacillus migulae]